MKFASVRQIVILTLLWTAALFIADSVMHPSTLAAIVCSTPAAVATEEKPRVTLSLNHVCCSGCLDDLRVALAGLSWIRNVRLSDGRVPAKSEVEAGLISDTGSAHRVEIEVARVEGLDFVVLKSAVRRAGFAVERMEVSGVPHYHFEVDLPHFCCRVCSLAATKETDSVRILRGSGRFQWLDSITVNKPRKRLIAYARYGQTANVSELEEALDWMGFAPSSIRLSVEGENVRM
jgi:hypothetical protein